MNTVEKLERIAELQAMGIQIAVEQISLTDAVMGPEVIKKLAEIEEEFANKRQILYNQVAVLEEEVKKDVIELKSSIDSDLLQAVYNKGRVTWDSGLLDGLAIAIPELNQARKQGDPFVIIKRKKV